MSVFHVATGALVQSGGKAAASDPASPPEPPSPVVPSLAASDPLSAPASSMLPPELEELLDELLEELDPLDDDEELLELLLDPLLELPEVEPPSPVVAGLELQAANAKPATAGAIASVICT